MHSSFRAGLPNIEGWFNIREIMPSGIILGRGGSFQTQTTDIANYATASANSPTKELTQVKFNASKSNSIYGSSTTVQPPSIALILQIKF